MSVGRNSIRQFFHITLPMLAPVMQVVFMLSMLSNDENNRFDSCHDNGQPGGSTEVVMTYTLNFLPIR